jgi:hypothetical protein
MSPAERQRIADRLAGARALIEAPVKLSVDGSPSWAFRCGQLEVMLRFQADDIEQLLDEAAGGVPA